jgi:hypothetical protein
MSKSRAAVRKVGDAPGSISAQCQMMCATQSSATTPLEANKLGRIRSYESPNPFLMNFTSSPARMALGNIGIGASSRTGGLGETPVRYWDEDDRRARYNAVSDALWIYQDREVEQNLRRFGWRQARRRVLAKGALSREWMNRGRGELRLTRGGLQMRFASGVRTIGWQELKDMIEARRS